MICLELARIMFGKIIGRDTEYICIWMYSESAIDDFKQVVSATYPSIWRGWNSLNITVHKTLLVEKNDSNERERNEGRTYSSLQLFYSSVFLIRTPRRSTDARVKAVQARITNTRVEPLRRGRTDLNTGCQTPYAWDVLFSSLFYDGDEDCISVRHQLLNN